MANSGAVYDHPSSRKLRGESKRDQRGAKDRTPPFGGSPRSAILLTVPTLGEAARAGTQPSRPPKVWKPSKGGTR
jgi:hypothetical protein